MTPEAKVKAKVRRVLEAYPGLYTFWPVPTGFGKTTLDVLGCWRGRFFAIETKAPGGKPTLRQVGAIRQIERAMGRTFVIDDVNSPVIDDLCAWLNELRDTIDDHPYQSRDPVSRRPI